jgi:hypothetical protein
MRRRRLLASLVALVLLGTFVIVAPAGVAAASQGVSSQISRTGTGGPRSGNAPPSGAGDATDAEFPGEEDEADEGSVPAEFNGVIDRSLAFGRGAQGPTISATARAKSNPTFKKGWEGLNHYQQRYSNRGNQFSLEPPDQGLCAGNGYVMETVNEVLNVFNQSDGSSALPNNTATNVVGGFPRNVNHAVDLNSFYGYPPAVNRTTGIRGQFLTDPSCLYDAQTNRWFHVVLTLETVPTTGAFTLENHLDIAVSQTGNPTGAWNLYSIDVTNDGTNTGGNTCGDGGNEPCNPGPYLGDYPQIGADANGFYVATNAYPWCCNGFAGAQIYALSKAQLAAGAASINMVHIDTSGTVNAPSDAGSTQPGFTVWPARSPNAASFNPNNGGTEFFLSSNAADEATHPVAGTGGGYTSNKIVLWRLTNTASLNTAAPALSLTNKLLPVGLYARAPKQRQPGSGTAPGVDTPQGHCINDTTTETIAGTGCWRLLFVCRDPLIPDCIAHDEVVSRPDAHDTRMQQVMYANGKVWGALDTAVTVGGENRAGIAYYIVNPGSGNVALGGYVGAAGKDLTYPAIGVTAAGRGVMAFTATGDTLFPSAAYAAIDAIHGVGAWNIVPGGQGQATDDGFTSYKSQVGNPPRTRWGDYGAAAVDGNAVWLASEYIAHDCDYAHWGGVFFGAEEGDNLLGTCAAAPGGVGVRSALANWSTFVSKFVP